MNFISNFYKFIVIILLIIILIKVINNLFETFTTSVATSTSVEEKIKFNLIKNNNNSVDITWNNNSEVTKYVIVKYINNTGPYIKVINGDTNKYTINDIIKNVNYKIGVVGVFKKFKGNKFHDILSSINDNIKEFTIDSLSDTLKVKSSSSFKSNILCDAKGQHKLVSSKNCKKSHNLNVVAMNSLTNNDYFSNETYIKLMDDLTDNSPLEYKVEFKI